MQAIVKLVDADDGSAVDYVGPFETEESATQWCDANSILPGLRCEIHLLRTPIEATDEIKSMMQNEASEAEREAGWDAMA